MTPANRQLSSDGSPTEWWFNTKSGLVEFGKLSAAPYRIGPFKSESEARQALELLAARAKSWRELDELED